MKRIETQKVMAKYVKDLNIGDIVQWIGTSPTYGKILRKDSGYYRPCYVVGTVTLPNGEQYNSCHEDNLKKVSKEKIKHLQKINPEFFGHPDDEPILIFFK